MAADSRGALTVVFASQTGAAQDAAECLAREAAKRRFAPVRVVSAGALAPAALPQLGLAVFVFATAGDGDTSAPCGESCVRGGRVVFSLTDADDALPVGDR